MLSQVVQGALQVDGVPQDDGGDQQIETARPPTSRAAFWEDFKRNGWRCAMSETKQFFLIALVAGALLNGCWFVPIAIDHWPPDLWVALVAGSFLFGMVAAAASFGIGYSAGLRARDREGTAPVPHSSE